MPQVLQKSVAARALGRHASRMHRPNVGTALACGDAISSPSETCLTLEDTLMSASCLIAARWRVEGRGRRLAEFARRRRGGCLQAVAQLCAKAVLDLTACFILRHAFFRWSSVQTIKPNAARGVFQVKNLQAAVAQRKRCPPATASRCSRLRRYKKQINRPKGYPSRHAPVFFGSHLKQAKILGISGAAGPAAAS